MANARTTPVSGSNPTSSPGVTVLVVDRHPLFAEALAVLVSAPAMETAVTAVNTYAQALEILSDRTIGLLLCEAAPAVAGWHSLLAEVADRWPKLPMVLLCELEDDGVLTALQAGVAGIFSKAAPAGELISGLKDVLGGDVVVDSTMRAWVVFVTSRLGVRPRRAFLHQLTPDQAAVLRRLTEERSIAEVAALTGLPQRDVVDEMGKIYGLARSLRSRTHRRR